MCRRADHTQGKRAFSAPWLLHLEGGKIDADLLCEML